MDADILTGHFREIYGRDLNLDAVSGYADIVAKLNAAIRDAAEKGLAFEDEPSAFLGVIARHGQL
ncbi:MAG: hypothetical protein FJY54_06760 [Betaproteobacteria bacterium]|nr:hypothetical protein [Betaproteobacteria bacterium]